MERQHRHAHPRDQRVQLADGILGARPAVVPRKDIGDGDAEAKLLSAADHRAEVRRRVGDRPSLRDVVDAALHNKHLGAGGCLVEPRGDLVGPLPVGRADREAQAWVGHRSRGRPADRGVVVPRRARRDRVADRGDVDFPCLEAHHLDVSIYHDGNRSFQDRFDTRRLADRIEERIVHDSIDEDDRAFIEARDMFFLATADADGAPQCSYKGGEPGFVRVLDEHTIAFPSFDGNGMYLSLGNLTENPHVGLLFIDFEGQKRLRLNGTASIDADDPLLAGYPRAQCVVRVSATEVFPNCPRYIHKLELVERSRFTPRADCEPPVPSWKRSDWARDVLAAGDPAQES